MKTIRLPGLIDVHVHLRDPGQTYKEDFLTGTTAAVFGGFTTVLDMPNNKLPITTKKRLQNKISIASKKTVCNIGFYFGSLGNNIDEFKSIYKSVFGLKLYLNQTTGNFIINKKTLENIYNHWDSSQPILLHGEEQMIKDIIDIIRITKKKTHICHVSCQFELETIIRAKKENLPITCGVTPHHLFLTNNYNPTSKGFGHVKPSLKTQKDNDYLLEHIEQIDVIESDHAPHTIIEKQSKIPGFGMPGLETTLPLLITAVHQKKITMKDIVRLCYENPRIIFNIPTDKNTFILVDTQKEFIIHNQELKTKCCWSPFHGYKLKGKVLKVVIRGETIMENGLLSKNVRVGKILKPINIAN